MLDPATTALVVVDMQRKSCDRTVKRGLAAWLRESDPNGAAAYFDRLEGLVIPNIQRLLAFFRQQGLVVMHFVVGPGTSDARDLPRAFRHLYQQCGGRDDVGVIHSGSPEFEIVPQAAPKSGERVIHKLTYGGFTGTGAEGLLRNMGIEAVVLVGGNTHVCVESTGRAAADLGFMVTAVEDALIDYEPLMHDAAMITFSTILGRVLSTGRGRRRTCAVQRARSRSGSTTRAKRVEILELRL